MSFLRITIIPKKNKNKKIINFQKSIPKSVFCRIFGTYRERVLTSAINSSTDTVSDVPPRLTCLFNTVSKASNSSFVQYVFL